jgi:Protein of unknown function (DUF2946)
LGQQYNSEMSLSFKKLAPIKHACALMALVFLFNLLLPTIAAATVKRDQYSTVFNVICTTAGLKVLDTGADATHSSAPSNGVHCPLCVLGNAPPLQGRSIGFFTAFTQHRLDFWGFVDNPQQAIFWPSATARAPPNGMIFG